MPPVLHLLAVWFEAALGVEVRIHHDGSQQRQAFKYPRDFGMKLTKSIGFLLLGMALAFAVTQLPKDWFKPDYLVDISSILTLISFSVRSMLTLRILAIGTQLTFIPYCFLQSTPLWTPIVWNMLFLSVNDHSPI
jgi:hypothetical protein